MGNSRGNLRPLPSFFLQVYIWVLNEDHEYKRAFDLGATGVMTDYPTKLKAFLHTYPA